MRYYILLFLIIFFRGLLAQDSLQRTLSYEEFLSLVRENHPLAMVANMQVDMGAALLTSARGNFDPVLFYERAQKEFKGDDYYSLTDQGLKLPTWFGMEFYTGLERNDGVFLDPENNTPTNGLYYAGVSLPVGRGLFIDKRRADLRKAYFNREAVAAERQIQLNKLLLEAGIAYWDWYAAYRKRQVFERSVAVARERLVGVEQSAELGDRAAIDTLEAGIQVQNRMISFQQANVDFLNATAMLSTFLWDDGMVPLELEEDVIPDPVLTPDLEVVYSGMDSLISNHPLIRTQELKVEQLEVDRRLAGEWLKPEVNLKYNLLSEPVEGPLPGSFNRNDFTWGLQVKFPLLLRKERGKFRMAGLKLQGQQASLSNYRQTVRYKVVSSRNDLENTRNQISLYEENVRNYASLLAGERRMFNLGESSLFLINSRELSYITAQVKLIDTIAKNRKAEIKLLYSLGILL